MNSITSIQVKKREPLAPFTTFKIGGTAKYFAAANSVEELKQLIEAAQKENLPVFILGGGSNILISDKGFDGLVIKIKMAKIEVENNLLKVEAGALLSQAVKTALANNLAGLEWATDIPGTIGGAIHGNAGAYGQAISDNLELISVWRNGKIENLKKEECGFDYRQSIFNQEGNRDIIISAVLRLAPGEAKEAAAKTKEIIAERRQRIASGFSAGSVFKNIKLSAEEMAEFKNKFSTLPEKFVDYQKIPAGWLIEQCGLKGKSVGGAKVSEKHAGMIINFNHATAEDVIMLISIIKQKVRTQFGLQLMEEIECVGF